MRRPAWRRRAPSSTSSMLVQVSSNPRVAQNNRPPDGPTAGPERTIPRRAIRPVSTKPAAPLVQQHGSREAGTFWSGCGAIRRRCSGHARIRRDLDEHGGRRAGRAPTPGGPSHSIVSRDPGRRTSSDGPWPASGAPTSLAARFLGRASFYGRALVHRPQPRLAQPPECLGGVALLACHAAGPGNSGAGLGRLVERTFPGFPISDLAGAGCAAGQRGREPCSTPTSIALLPTGAGPALR